MGFARHFFLRKPPGGEYHLISRDWGTNQIARKALFTCVVYTKKGHTSFGWWIQPFLSQEWLISNFPCSLTKNTTSHSMKNLACHSLLRWKMIILPILITSLRPFFSKGWENVLSELGSKRVICLATSVAQLRRFAKPLTLTFTRTQSKSATCSYIRSTNSRVVHCEAHEDLWLLVCTAVLNSWLTSWTPIRVRNSTRKKTCFVAPVNLYCPTASLPLTLTLTLTPPPPPPPNLTPCTVVSLTVIAGNLTYVNQLWTRERIRKKNGGE